MGMKLILSIAAAILVAVAVGWSAVDYDGFRHTFAGYNQREIDHAQLELRTQISRSNRELDDRLLETQIRHVELTLGEAAASTYRLCHAYPPTTPQHKAKCKRIDDQLAKVEAEESRNPW